MKYERGSFITVPSREVLRGLHPTAQALYMWLCSYANETGQCFPSRRTLAEDVGCSEDTIDKMLGILVETGIVKKRGRVEKGEKLSNLYTVLVVEGSRQNRLPSPPESARVAARIGINSIQLTQSNERGGVAANLKVVTTPEGANEYEKPEPVIPSPYSAEATRDAWRGHSERRLVILRWFLDEKDLWEKATSRAKLQAIMRRHNNAAVRIAKTKWTFSELEEAQAAALKNKAMEDEWTLETLEKYLTK